MKRPPSQPCPSCGGLARIPVDNGKQQACARCGTVVPPLPFGAGAGGWGKRFSETPLHPGMKARTENKDFYATACIKWEQRDSDGIYRWEEWVLVSPEGDVRYLEYDKGKWTMTEAMTAKSSTESSRLMAVIPGDQVQLLDRLVNVTDAGRATVIAIAGEPPYPLAKGDEIRFVDAASSGGAIYSVEVDPQTGEVEWFRGRRVGEKSVYQMFGLNQEVTRVNKREVTLKDRRFFGALVLTLSLVSLILYGVARGRGAVAAQDSVAASQIPEEGRRFGPYHLTDAGRVHRLHLSTQMLGTSVWVQAVLENEKAGAMFGADEEFWDESGSDSDGAWHEWVLESRKEFRLAKAGDVYVRLFADPEAAATNVPVSFKVEKNVMYPLHFLTFGLIALPIGLGFLIASASSTTSAAWAGMSTD